MLSQEEFSLLESFKAYWSLCEDHARIDSKQELSGNFKITINGGGNHGRSEHGLPHFTLTKDNNDWSIKIPTIEEWKTSKELMIIAGDKSELTFKELRYLSDWLDKKCKKLDGKTTNVNFCRIIWNTVNQDNPQVQEIKPEKLDD